MMKVGRDLGQQVPRLRVRRVGGVRRGRGFERVKEEIKEIECNDQSEHSELGLECESHC